MTTDEKKESLDFIRTIVEDDLRTGKHAGVVTRFPPEPNGYLHIGHAKAICLDFGIAQEYGGRCHLRFDDTNPETESEEYVRSIMHDVRWLGFDWGEHLYFASDYFGKMCAYAEQLIRQDQAYVCELSTEEFKEYRGAPNRPGRHSPGRARSSAENLDLFARMKAGEFPDGRYVLRAKIDMASPNIHMRDPVLYRIKRVSHHRTGEAWTIYPSYDFAHCLEDSAENITHSLCTLEFEVHRPLYDWILEALGIYHPRQIEFSRLNLSYTVMSKRKLLQLVREGLVNGWDDPRLPTLAGLRRRGYTPSAIRAFCARVGITKFDGVTDVALLEHCVRDELNREAPRAMAVLDPLKLVLTNYPAELAEEMNAVNNPENPAAGSRKIPFSRELYIEREDFMEDAPKKYHRLTPGQEVRLRYGYIVRCTSCVKDPATGVVTEVHATYDPATRGGDAPDGRKIRGTIHWVPAAGSVECEARMFDRLFTCEQPENVPEGVDFKDNLNPASMKTCRARVEPMLATAQPGSRYQFERKGYFHADPVDSRPGAPVFNLIATLRDSWSKTAQST